MGGGALRNLVPGRHRHRRARKKRRERNNRRSTRVRDKVTQDVTEEEEEEGNGDLGTCGEARCRLHVAGGVRS